MVRLRWKRYASTTRMVHDSFWSFLRLFGNDRTVSHPRSIVNVAKLDRIVALCPFAKY